MTAAHTPSPDFLRAYFDLYGRPHPQDQRRTGRFNRARLPDPARYYAKHLGLSTAGRRGWVSAICRLHDDREPSLSVNLDHGGFRCHACGASGGSVLDFHIQCYGLQFTAAAKDLGAWDE